MAKVTTDINWTAANKLIPGDYDITRRFGSQKKRLFLFRGAADAQSVEEAEEIPRDYEPRRYTVSVGSEGRLYGDGVEIDVVPVA